MKYRSRRRRVAAGIAAMITISMSTFVNGCVDSTSPLNLDERNITAVVLSHFLRTNSNNWPVVYLSDQYLSFAFDSVFVRSLPNIGTRYVIAWRADAEESPDIVKEEGLLLEPLMPGALARGYVRQPLNFSANAQFGGEYLYTLRRILLEWRVTRIVPVWVV